MVYWGGVRGRRESYLWRRFNQIFLSGGTESPETFHGQLGALYEKNSKKVNTRKKHKKLQTV